MGGPSATHPFVVAEVSLLRVGGLFRLAPGWSFPGGGEASAWVHLAEIVRWPIRDMAGGLTECGGCRSLAAPVGFVGITANADECAEARTFRSRWPQRPACVVDAGGLGSFSAGQDGVIATAHLVRRMHAPPYRAFAVVGSWPRRGCAGARTRRARLLGRLPGILYEPDRQRFLLSYRQRRPRGTAPDRGWRCALAASSDGVRFDDIWEIRKGELGTASMERFCMIPAPGGGYRLYISYVDPADNRWRIDVLEAADPASFAVRSARPALTAAGTGTGTGTGTEGVKDPYVLRIGPVTYLFASFAAARAFTAEERQRAHSTGDIYNAGMTTHPTGLTTSGHRTRPRASPGQAAE